MEKVKHIFVYPLLLAWLVIFFHDTIPHNHSTHQHLLVEHSDTCLVESNVSCCQHINDAHDHHSCKFSAKLFANLAIDHYLVVPSNLKMVTQDAIKTFFGTFTDQIHNKPLYLYHFALRAPPAA